MKAKILRVPSTFLATYQNLELDIDSGKKKFNMLKIILNIDGWKTQKKKLIFHNTR